MAVNGQNHNNILDYATPESLKKAPPQVSKRKPRPLWLQGALFSCLGTLLMFGTLTLLSLVLKWKYVTLGVIYIGLFPAWAVMILRKAQAARTDVLPNTRTNALLVGFGVAVVLMALTWGIALYVDYLVHLPPKPRPMGP